MHTDAHLHPRPVGRADPRFALLWVLTAVLGWSAFHPRGTTIAADGFQFALGGLTTTALQSALIASWLDRRRAGLRWLVSGALWLAAAALFSGLPWGTLGESLSEGLFLTLILTLGIALGSLQATAFDADDRAEAFWPFLVAGALLAGVFAAIGLRLAAPFLGLQALPFGDPFLPLGAFFGLVFGVLTGVPLMILLHGREAD